MDIGIKIAKSAMLARSNFHIVLKTLVLKLSINVPIAKAGTNRIFSNFESTLDEFSGTKFHLESINPITINANRNII